MRIREKQADSEAPRVQDTENRHRVARYLCLDVELRIQEASGTWVAQEHEISVSLVHAGYNTEEVALYSA